MAARISLGALLFTTALLAVDRVITGIVQCSALGCLPA